MLFARETVSMPSLNLLASKDFLIQHSAVSISTTGILNYKEDRNPGMEDPIIFKSSSRLRRRRRLRTYPYHRQCQLPLLLPPSLPPLLLQHRRHRLQRRHHHLIKRDERGKVRCITVLGEIRRDFMPDPHYYVPPDPAPGEAISEATFSGSFKKLAKMIG